jgi:hypothetical protein
VREKSMKKYYFLLLIIFLLSIYSTSNAGELKNQYIKEFIIEGTENLFSQKIDQLDKDLLENWIRIQFEEYKIFAPKKKRKGIDFPTLYINYTYMDIDNYPTLIFYVELELLSFQYIKQYKTDLIKEYYRNGWLGFYRKFGSAGIRNLEEKIKDLVRDFIKSWLEDNNKKKLPKAVGLPAELREQYDNMKKNERSQQK